MLYKPLSFARLKGEESPSSCLEWLLTSREIWEEPEKKAERKPNIG